MTISDGTVITTNLQTHFLQVLLLNEIFFEMQLMFYYETGVTVGIMRQFYLIKSF